MNRVFDVSGKVAIVTGSSSGLGVQFAKVLAEHGVNLILAARRIQRMESLAAELEQKGVKVIPIKCDVTQEEDVKNVVQKAIDEFGRVDILINNAGLGAVTPLEKTTLEEWENVHNVNVAGVFLFIKHVIPYMKEKQYGKIINISSMFGHVGNTAITTAAYHSSKGAVDNLTNALAGEFSKYGITSNAIGPGFFESEMTEEVINDEDFLKFIQNRCPMGRPGKAGELDGALLFLASDASSYVSGVTIYVDGGWTSV
ncbi:gluconate 5-dehydrogenase [Natronocella acetinitrilica]|uniref:Gluconate 5-dehydrogenase n=1 Tax=Natronocella acetinitrilica TaxID=414046 RepID=A0AAE3GBJ7_9GAMM|nr:glucose 1-dehydrogenase [Natronocella acetinitrilica]MCP1677277.1 gluconate 5-dehydrogenase [Natronocella acetinitrilica]